MSCWGQVHEGEAGVEQHPDFRLAARVQRRELVLADLRLLVVRTCAARLAHGRRRRDQPAELPPVHRALLRGETRPRPITIYRLGLWHKGRIGVSFGQSHFD